MDDYKDFEISEGSEELNKEIMEDTREALDDLINLALYLHVTKGADIKHTPIIQEVKMDFDGEGIPIESGEKAFRITVQEIEPEEAQR